MSGRKLSQIGQENFLIRLGSSFGEHQMNKPVLPKAPQVREKDQNNGEMDANYFLNSFGLTGNSLRGYSSPERIGSPLKVKRHSTVEEDNYSQVLYFLFEYLI